MDYLDEWITAGDALRQRYFPNVVKADTSELQAERMALRKRGEWIRQRCLFTDVDDKNQWLEKLRITKATVELNLRMVRSMSDGFHSLLRFNGMDEEGGFAVPPE